MAQLELNYANQYGSNVYIMAQQRGSVLRNFVTVRAFKGEKLFLERVQATAAVRADSKYADTPLIHTRFDRRALHAQEYTWADMIDWMDDYNLFIDPASDICKVGGMALGRTIDDIIIADGFDGVAFEGKEGLVTVPFPDSQKIPITLGGQGGANVGFNTEKLIEARSRFGKADIDFDDPDNKLFIAVTQSQMDDLARSVDVKHHDYQAIMDLYEGRTKTFLGFTFVQCGRLKKTAIDAGQVSRRCAAWCKSGVILGEPKAISMSVSTRPDKNDNWQALAKMKAGATRIEDAKVVQIECLENE